MFEVVVKSMEKAKLEDGDLLLVTVSETTSTEVMMQFQNHMNGVIREVMKVNAVSEVVSCDGEVRLDVIKHHELSDIYQRLDELERKLVDADIQIDKLERAASDA